MEIIRVKRFSLESGEVCYRFPYRTGGLVDQVAKLPSRAFDRGISNDNHQLVLLARDWSIVAVKFSDGGAGICTEYVRLTPHGNFSPYHQVRIEDLYRALYNSGAYTFTLPDGGDYTYVVS